MDRRERVAWVDMLKGVGIILVVVGHTPAFTRPYWFFSWIYSFHMPLFFFAVGLVLRDDPRGGIAEFVQRRAFRRLIPYLVYSILSILLYTSLFQHFGRAAQSPIPLRDQFLSVLQGHPETNPPLWFYPVLLGAEVIATVILLSIKSMGGRIVALLGLIAVAGIGFSTTSFIRACLMPTAFLLVGFYSQAACEKLSRRSPAFWIGALALFLPASLSLAAVQLRSMGERTGIEGNYGIVPVYVLCALADIASCCCLCLALERCRAVFLSSIGRATGVVFPLHELIHPFITAFLVFVLHQPYQAQDTSWGWGLFYVLLTIAIGWMTHRLLKEAWFAVAFGL